jgi:carbon monoxide dehydrogenase subunit G
MCTEGDPLLSIAARILGTLTGLLILFLVVGLLLPGSWEARWEAEMAAPPEDVFPFLDEPHRWTLWMPLPPSGIELFGPAAGPGAGLRWKDSHYGEGEFRIVASQANAEVQYEVALEGGSLQIRGALTLHPEGGGARLKWQEWGDFGWNPLLGYTARGMARGQSRAMAASLENLRELLEEAPAQPGDPGVEAGKVEDVSAP